MAVSLNSLKPVLVWTARICLFLVPIIPLFIARELLFPYITGKAFIFRSLVEIAFVAWLFLAVYFSEYRPKKTVLLWAVAIFIGIVTLATILGINPYKALWSSYERMEGLIAYLHLFAYFLVLANVFRSQDWMIFLNVFVVAGLAENFYALRQKLGLLPSLQGGFRVDGTIGNPTYLAGYLIFILAFCILLWHFSRTSPVKYFYAATAGFTLLTIYFTASRGPVLAVIGAMFLAGILYLIFNRSESRAAQLFRRVVWSGLGLIFVAVALLGYFHDSEFIRSNPNLDRLTSLSFKERTVASRFAIWDMSWDAVKERPILGWGPESYLEIFSKYYRPELWPQEPWFDRAHNIVFDWLINAGMLGLISYLGVMTAAVYLLWQGFRKKKIELVAAILFSVLFLAYFFQNLFVFDNLATYIGFFAALAFIQWSVVGDSAAGHSRRSARFLFWPAAGIGLLVALFLGIYFINWKPFRANEILINAMQLQSSGQLSKAMQEYQLALSYDTFGNTEIREALARFASGVAALPQVEVGFKKQVLELAITEMERNVKTHPDDPREMVILGEVYSRAGLIEKAIQSLESARAISPKKQHIYFELTDLYRATGDLPKATEFARQAFDLAPDYSLARINLAVIYIVSGNQKEADRLLKEEYGIVEVADKLLASVYADQKKYDRLVGVWRAFVKGNPTNKENWIGLAGSYLLWEKPNEAVKVLREAVQSIPDFQAEAESYIKEILKGS